ncbi:unnamed protein product [[Actinomadura] parvosata subsp. kistnae]|uniref:hypothetical protein n=1 Tax=[Actinomadura] parvosata TaxID=1955412 RepID=UPI000D283943|nr:hypothetical protein [Nonomuraea sp. ATCC 55076]SPL94285.1 unnamed protein product [Actinomadura parvosata subsp. kistnae]
MTGGGWRSETGDPDGSPELVNERLSQPSLPPGERSSPPSGPLDERLSQPSLPPVERLSQPSSPFSYPSHPSVPSVPSVPSMPPTTELTDPDVGHPAPPGGPRKRFRSLLIGGASVAFAVVVAAGVLVASRQGDDQTAQLAGNLFAAGTAGAADGRQLELNGVAAMGATVVVAGGEDADSGYRTEFFLSKDAGRTFTRAQVRTAKGEPPVAGEVPRHLAAGPAGSAGWVALGDRVGGTVVWTSPDGASWTRQPDATASLAFGPRDRVADVAWTGGGFTAVGQTSDKGDFTDAAPVVWLSRDGRSWERRAGWRLHPPTGGTLALTDVASVKNAIVVRGESSIKPYDITWRSTDAGDTWQAFAVPGTSSEPELSFASTATAMLALRQGGSHATTYTSPDGVHWTTAAKIDVPGFKRLSRLTATPQAAVAAIETDSGIRLVRSVDGRSWQPAGTTAGGAEVRDTAAVGDNTVAVGAQDGTGALLAVRDKAGKEVPARIPDTTGSGKVVDALGTADGRVVAVGGANGDATVWTSADGSSWQPVQDKDKALTGQGRQRLTGVTAGFAGWLAVGSSGRTPGRPLVVTSADGESWRRADGAAAFQSTGKEPLIARATAAGPDGYVIVGEDGYGAGTWWSPDLKTWERGTPAGQDNLVGTPTTRRWMNSVTNGMFGFVAAGGVTDPNAYGGVFVRRPTVWISPDGRKWSLVRLPIPAGVNEGWLTHIASHDDVLVTAGTAVTGNGTGTAAFGYASTDGGRSWQQITLPVTAGEQSGVTAVATTPRGFVVAGTVGSPGDVVVWTSADGRSWKPEQPRGAGVSGPGDQRLSAFTTVDGELVGVGSTATGHGDEPTLWRRPLSPDEAGTP